MDRKIERPHWMPRRLLLVAAVVATLFIVALVTFAISHRQRSLRVQSKDVTVGELRRGVFHDFVPIRGKAVARDVVYVDAPEGGRVERIHAYSGDVVAEGQLLIEFGNTSLQLEVIDREALLIQQINSLRLSQLQLEQTRLANQRAIADFDYEIERLEKQLERRAALDTKQFVSAEEREELTSKVRYLHTLRAAAIESSVKQETLRVLRLPEIDDGLRKLQQNLEITRGKLDGLLLRAPVSGRVSGFEPAIGRVYARGDRVAQVTPATGFKLVVDLDEFYVTRVKIGQKATFQLGTTPIVATVKRVSGDVNNGRFGVELTFDDGSPEALLAGQALEGNLRLGEDRVTQFLPAGLFVDHTGGQWVYALSKDGQTAMRRQIRMGRRTAEQVELLGGMEVGERAIVSNYRDFGDAEIIELR